MADTESAVDLAFRDPCRDFRLAGKKGEIFVGLRLCWRRDYYPHPYLRDQAELLDTGAGGDLVR